MKKKGGEKGEGERGGNGKKWRQNEWEGKDAHVHLHVLHNKLHEDIIQYRTAG